MTTRKVLVKEVLDYLSVDYASCGYFRLYCGTVGDFLFGTMRDHGDCPLAITMESMRTEGQKYPIHVGMAENIGSDYGIDPLAADGMMALGNGHNRVYAAFLLGWEYIEVTDRKEESGLTAGIKIARELEKVG